MAEAIVLAVGSAFAAWAASELSSTIDSYSALCERLPVFLDMLRAKKVEIQQIDQEDLELNDDTRLKIEKMRTTLWEFERIITICMKNNLWSIVRSIFYCRRYTDQLNIRNELLSCRMDCFTFGSAVRQTSDREKSLREQPVAAAAAAVTTTTTPPSPSTSQQQKLGSGHGALHNSSKYAENKPQRKHSLESTSSSSASSGEQEPTPTTLAGNRPPLKHTFSYMKVGSWDTKFELKNAPSHKMLARGTCVTARQVFDHLVLLLWGGTNIEIEVRVAQAWLEELSESLGNQDDAVLKGYLGIVLDPNFHGVCVVKDKACSQICFSHAESLGLKDKAERGCPHAQFLMGWWIYKYGKKYDDRWQKSFRYFSRAAEQGHSKALQNLGFMHEHGQGIPPDTGKAIECYEKSAEAGNASGQYSLGYLQRDDNEKFRLMELAAKSGLAEAQYWVGANYVNDPQRKEEGMRLLELAAEQGQEQAVRKLTKRRTSLPSQ